MPDQKPAFPFIIPNPRPGEPDIYPGLTMRDYFAAHAMAAIIMTNDADPGMTLALEAEEAYRYADAMMEEREKRHETP